MIVIGLDGLEPGIVGPLLEAGDLPHLRRVREQGGSGRVATTSPAQTPVAWSTFATGVNPGGHGIFDFLRRDPKTYRPDIALSRYVQANAFMPPKAVNLRGGTPVWDRLGDKGLHSSIIRCPATYPPDKVRGRMLSGMGVPDLRGGFGTATVYSSAPDAVAREGEQLVRLASDRGTIATEIIGPRNPKDRSDLRLPISVDVDHDGRKVTIRSTGSPERLEVREGAWSDWLKVAFKSGPLRTTRAIVRFYLTRVGPTLELYASPVNFDPASPAFPISSPAAFSGELAEEIGPYHTTGMVEDHAGLNNGRFDERGFLDQCDTAWREREAMMVSELECFEEGMFYCLFDTPDRVQHMLWRHREPDHPANSPDSPADPALAEVLLDQYRRADRMLGLALQHADDQTLVIALSDHGFGTYRRGVNLNTWLHEKGLLALKPGLKPGEGAGDLLMGVDWEKTSAYSLGLGGIYVNLRGREGKGIVDPSEAEALKAKIAGALGGLADPEKESTTAIRSVRPREEVYRGAFLGDAPDLVVNFAYGYRASSATSMGGVPEATFEDNTKKWSGDHIVDPALVPGILFMNRPFRAEGARLEDLAPTILAALGCPPGPEMEGRSLLS
ncbi:alkaline phosphatase family protein [Tundrisphaera sp. TA3]|uniref:alkaline phosphatase family protein n=1 Tax=Tundrisphaera sp. TA3 TaxID=3435775 RepID=UPI003EB6D9CF